MSVPYANTSTERRPGAGPSREEDVEPRAGLLRAGNRRAGTERRGGLDGRTPLLDEPNLTRAVDDEGDAALEVPRVVPHAVEPTDAARGVVVAEQPERES